jgi:hypothetical protein
MNSCSKLAAASSAVACGVKATMLCLGVALDTAAFFGHLRWARTRIGTKQMPSELEDSFRTTSHFPSFTKKIVAHPGAYTLRGSPGPTHGRLMDRGLIASCVRPRSNRKNRYQSTIDARPPEVHPRVMSAPKNGPFDSSLMSHVAIKI